MLYSIRKVDPDDDDILHELRVIHKLTFHIDQMPSFIDGHWWFAYFGKDVVAFGGIQQSRWHNEAGYLVRSGVLPECQGRGLQRRLLRVREAYAKRVSWTQVITDTTCDNIHSANNLIKSGYLMFTPKMPWALSTSIYFRKQIAAHDDR